MAVSLKALDHLVLTVLDIRESQDFYCRVLGMGLELFYPADGTERVALKFGEQKINLHQRGAEFEPKAKATKPGSADLCFLSENSLAQWARHLQDNGVPIEQGPVPRTGATGPIQSIYVRDPDGNLIEIANPD